LIEGMEFPIKRREADDSYRARHRGGRIEQTRRNGGFFVARTRGSPTDGFQKAATAIEKGKEVLRIRGWTDPPHGFTPQAIPAGVVPQRDGTAPVRSRRNSRERFRLRRLLVTLSTPSQLRLSLQRRVVRCKPLCEMSNREETMRKLLLASCFGVAALFTAG
jgi:hypothetical protein